MTERRADDPIATWFLTAEQMGDFIGIRFGRIAPGAVDPEWEFLPHTDFDGIGGFAELLRRRGATLDRLPQIKHPLLPSFGAFLRTAPKYLGPRRRVRWRPVDPGAAPKPAAGGRPTPPPAVAWHVFDEGATTQIRRVCRKLGVTVNSFLIKHLTKGVRPFLEDESSVVPWMIPVNLRGKVDRGRDTAMHTSYVSLRVKSYETVHDIHRSIYAALGRGEHWANWRVYGLGRFTTEAMRQWLVRADMGFAQWNLGSFSNLGDWDAEKKIAQPACLGDWLFTPLSLQCLVVAAGCVTFQNRLSLTIQVHPELTRSPALPKAWVQNWVREIEMDLASLLEPAMPWPKG